MKILILNVMTIAIFFTSKNTFAHNYLHYLNLHAGPNMAVLVIDMYESFDEQLPGNSQTSKAISSSVQIVSDKGGMVICIIEDLLKPPKKTCPEAVIPASVKDTGSGRRYISLEKPRLSAFDGTELQQQLLVNNIQHVLITGAYTGLCIRDTVMDALSRGFQVSLFFDAVTSTPGMISTYNPSFMKHLMPDEDEDFLKLAEEFRAHKNQSAICIICSPSRNSSRRDQGDGGGFGFQLLQQKNY